MAERPSTQRLEIAECRRAVEQSDAGFDGLFWFGVTSTGIYCRPSCPSRTPKPENTRYFTTTSRARAEGFRACRRCHPDAAVGQEPQRVVALRALELIREGVVEREGVAGLAQHLNYSERQLHRLLTSEFGAPALELARRERSAV